MLADYARLIADGRVHVADDDGVAGVLVLQPLAEHLHVENVAVDPSRQKQGIGKALMAFAEEKARRLGLGRIELYTHETMVENLPFYAGLGYDETGRGREDGYDRIYFAKAVGRPAANDDETAGVVIRPPILYGSALLIGAVMEFVWPSAFLPAAWLSWLGWAMFVLGGCFAVPAFRGFSKAGTNVPTWMPTTALVTTGIYGLSRNPIYVGLTLAFLGIAVAADSLWILLLAIPVLAVMQWGVVMREERYLERRFGDAYRSYRARVRRWI